MVERLDREQLIQLMEIVMRPKGKGFSSEEINKKLLIFCANCPDPVGAMKLFVEGMTPMTAEQLVDAALAMPQRNPKDLPASELPLGHPLREMNID